MNTIKIYTVAFKCNGEDLTITCKGHYMWEALVDALIYMKNTARIGGETDVKFRANYKKGTITIIEENGEEHVTTFTMNQVGEIFEGVDCEMEI